MKRKPFYKTLQALTLLLLALATMASAANVTLQENSDGKYVVIPTTGTSNLTITAADIASGLTTFNVYPEGSKELTGSGCSYNENMDGTLVLTVPVGYTLSIPKEDVYLDKSAEDYLTIYDGNVGSNKFLDASHGDYYIRSFNGSSNTVSFFMHSGDRNGVCGAYSSGALHLWKITMTVNSPRSIELNQAENGGSATINKTAAAMGEIVTLTATPESGFRLNDLQIQDGDGNPVDIGVDIDWYSSATTNTAKFFMPNSNVIVTPVFTNELSANGGLYLIVPRSGVKNVSVPSGMNSFKIYDDGGKNGKYSPDVNGYLKLTAPLGATIQVTGKVNTYACNAALTIYDGDVGSNMLLEDKSHCGSSQASIGTLMSTENMLTFFFYDKQMYAMSDAGLDLTVTVFLPNSVSLNQAQNGGAATIDKDGYAKGESVVVTATPNEGFLLSGLEIRDSKGKIKRLKVDVDWYSDAKTNTATFIMPDEDISITPVFTNDFTAVGGLYLNMPKTGKKNITIPDAVSSFKVYDDGGKNADYSPDADSHLELISPRTTDRLQIAGSIWTYGSHASLSIYNGLGTSYSNIILDSKYSDISRQDFIDTIVGAESKMSFWFKSEYYAGISTTEGLDLTVTVFPLRTISLNQADEGGSANISTQSANKGASVTVTATPSSGYLLKGLKIKGANGKVLNIPTDVNWLNSKNSSVNTASFTMPDENITVTPVFTNVLNAENLFVTMSITKGSGTQTRYIPSGVTSFKLYDDGGKDGNYTADSYGWWELNAPKGSRLQVTGTVYTNGEHASLTIYDSKSNLYSDKNKILDQAHSTSSKAIDIGTIMSTDSVLTFYFNADENATTKPGLDLTVTVFAPRSITLNNGEVDVSLDKTTASYSETVELSAKVNGKWLKEVAITDAIGNPLDVDMDISWTQTTYNGVSVIYSSAKFAMPNTDVVLTPVFVDEGSAEAGLYVKIPATGSKTVSQDEVPSFKVYDNGGESGNYGMNVDGMLILKPKYAYKVKVTGTVQTNGTHAYLTAFDVEGNEENVLLDQTSSVTNEKVDVSFESDKAVKLSFHSDASTTQESGLDLKVEFVPIGYTITVNQAENGTIECDMEAANNGDSVTVTAYPAEGYLLKEIKVINSNGGSIGSHIATNETVDWYSDPTKNTVKFAMPSLNVSIVPVFTKSFGDFVVTIPRTGTKNVSLSPYMNQFRVYNDGRNSRSGLLNQTYAYNADGNIVITAPEGYLLEVTGSVQTRTYSYLTIFDGETDADNLLDPLSSTCDDNGTCAKMDVGTLISSGRKVTLYFKGGSTSSGYTTTYYNGVNLVVKLKKTNFGAVNIAYSAAGATATINGDYSENETLSIPKAIEVDAVDYNRELKAGIPVTALLPVTLPAGTTVNADFYTLKEVVQDGNRWHATMKYIGDGNLPQPNTPYAVILHDGESELKFDLNGEKATVQTGDVQKTCGFEEACTFENGQIKDDWFFTGTYAYKQWNAGDGELGLAYAFAATNDPGSTAEGKFGKIIAGAYASPMRCYLRKRDADVKLQKASQVAAASYVSRYSVNYVPETDFVDVEFVKDGAHGEKTTAIGRMNVRTGEFEMLRNFDLKGRKVNSTNRARGAYYGKKVMKK